MPVFAVNMKHTPESCPLFNEAVKKRFKAGVGKREAVAQKHGVEVLSAVTSVLDHLIFFVVESSSQVAVEDYFKETGLAFWNDIEIRQARFVEDVLKKL